jgi:hypothetical protein
MQNRVFLWIAAVTGIILLIPLIAMQFSADVVWTLSDFVVMGILLFGAGSVFVLAARRLPKRRLAVGLVVGFLLMWLYVELAVGLFTHWGS